MEFSKLMSQEHSKHNIPDTFKHDEIILAMSDHVVFLS